MSDQVWVEIGDGVSIGIDRDEAMSLDRRLSQLSLLAEARA